MKSKMSVSSRVLVLLASLALAAVFFFPLWSIYLVAPQYPEGLALYIWTNKLSGDVDIVNGLNHYIGMKTLHAEDFIEFKVLPYLVGFFTAAGLIVAALNRRKALYWLTVLFIIMSVTAMADFYRWEYDYGHSLNPDAAIKVPGMAYQPPLIGYKQLLNFGAYSYPNAGGWLFIAAGVMLVVAVFLEWRKAKKAAKSITAKTAVAAMAIFVLSSCQREPKQINYGKDNCDFCKMTITDNRFGGELVTKKGKVYKFDDTHCLIEFKKVTNEKDLAGIYLVNFSGTHDFIKAEEAILLKSGTLNSPMGGNIAAFKNETESAAVKKQFEGQVLKWADIIK